MKKTITLILVLLLPVLVCGQGKIYTKKTRLSAYVSKTTKVVLPGNTVMDALLLEEIPHLWTLTPYEFCTEEEYDRLREQPGYYFLRFVRVSGEEQTPGLLYLDLSQGGNADRESLDAAFDIIQIPFASSEEKMLTPLEAALVPAMIDIVQQYVIEASSSAVAATAGLSWYHRKPALGNDGILTVSAEAGTAALMLEEGREDAAVAVIVGPREKDRKARYYHMVIGAGNHKLSSCNVVKGGSEFSASELRLFSSFSDGTGD